MNIKVSKREREILGLVSEGLTDKEIGSILFISYHTVISHKKRLIKKLDAKNAPSLVRKAFENGLIETKFYNYTKTYC